MRAIILELLEYTEAAYEALLLDRYLLWCNLNSHDDIDCQKLLANPVLFKWWELQYRTLERKFMEDAYPFLGKADKGVMRDLYTDYTIEIGQYYPRPLLKMARKQNQVISQHN